MIVCLVARWSQFLISLSLSFFTPDLSISIFIALFVSSCSVVRLTSRWDDFPLSFLSVNSQNPPDESAFGPRQDIFPYLLSCSSNHSRTYFLPNFLSIFFSFPLNFSKVQKQHKKEKAPKCSLMCEMCDGISYNQYYYYEQ